MANIKQQKKRVIIAQRQRFENLRYKSTAKTLLRSLQDAVNTGDKTVAESAHKDLVRLLDRAAARRALHPNTVARKKARAYRLLISEPVKETKVVRRTKKTTQRKPKATTATAAKTTAKAAEAEAAAGEATTTEAEPAAEQATTAAKPKAAAKATAAKAPAAKKPAAKKPAAPKAEAEPAAEEAPAAAAPEGDAEPAAE